MHYKLDAKPGNYKLEGKSVTTKRLILSRQEKFSHGDTVRYEIYMLRHAIGRLSERTLTGRDAWIYLEAFLLHYRNLIEFLGGKVHRDGDLRVTNIWQLEGLPAPQNLDQIHQKGTDLLLQYEPRHEEGGGRISQYLQHCTTKRTVAKDWEVTKMTEEIEPLLSELEKHLGPHTGIARPVPARGSLSMFSASTATVSITATDALCPGTESE
jgi:hypothetical protein